MENLTKVMHSLPTIEKGFTVDAIIRKRDGVLSLELRFDESKIDLAMKAAISEEGHLSYCPGCKIGTVFSSMVIPEMSKPMYVRVLNDFLASVDRKLTYMRRSGEAALELAKLNQQLVDSVSYKPGVENRSRSESISDLELETSFVEYEDNLVGALKEISNTIGKGFKSKYLDEYREADHNHEDNEDGTFLERNFPGLDLDLKDGSGLGGLLGLMSKLGDLRGEMPDVGDGMPSFEEFTEFMKDQGYDKDERMPSRSIMNSRLVEFYHWRDKKASKNTKSKEKVRGKEFFGGPKGQA